MQTRWYYFQATQDKHGFVPRCLNRDAKSLKNAPLSAKGLAVEQERPDDSGREFVCGGKRGHGETGTPSPL
ncbi:UNVERIFIED_CONTAM: hypothetical protein K2H54_006077 [Gekko kuhli]